MKRSDFVLVLFMLLGLAGMAVSVSGCAHLSPNVQQYFAAFRGCLTEKGVADVGNVGPQIIQILETGGSSAAQIEQQIEGAAISLGGQVGISVAECAVESWFAQHPVATTKAATPSQAAARIWRARHPTTGAHSRLEPDKDLVEEGWIATGFACADGRREGIEFSKSGDVAVLSCR